METNLVNYTTCHSPRPTYIHVILDEVGTGRTDLVTDLTNFPKLWSSEDSMHRKIDYMETNFTISYV
jgi:hypothetical protein